MNSKKTINVHSVRATITVFCPRAYGRIPVLLASEMHHKIFLEAFILGGTGEASAAFLTLILRLGTR